MGERYQGIKINILHKSTMRTAWTPSLMGRGGGGVKGGNQQDQVLGQTGYE